MERFGFWVQSLFFGGDVWGCVVFGVGLAAVFAEIGKISDVGFVVLGTFAVLAANVLLGSVRPSGGGGTGFRLCL